MKSLTFRLTFWYACVVTVTVALVLLGGRYYLEASLIKGIDFLNDAEFEEIANRLEAMPADADDLALVGAIREHTEIDAALYFFQISDREGRILFRSANLGGESLPESIHGHRRLSISEDEVGPIRVGEYAFRDLDVHIASSLQSVHALFGKYSAGARWILVIIFMVSVALGLVLSRIALNPVNEIQAIARRISAQNLSERIPVPNTGDELSRLSEFLNEMFDRLERAFEQISRFTADASHELRTPLSLIRLHAERLLRNPQLTADERTHELQEQMTEIERLNRLIDDLLFIARADAGVLRLSRKPIDVRNYLEDFAEDALVLCDDREVTFELVQDAGTSSLEFDPVWMRHVLLNLLSNALKVSSPGASIRLFSKPLSSSFWTFILEDEGPGLPPENAEQIFERFQRRPAPDRDTPNEGTGLGLAICRSIVNQHNGRIYARPRTDRSGLALHVELPR